jgi:hypothetical protein
LEEEEEEEDDDDGERLSTKVEVAARPQGPPPITSAAKDEGAGLNEAKLRLRRLLSMAQCSGS